MLLCVEINSGDYGAATATPALLLFATATRYTHEVIDIIGRLGWRIEAFVHNLDQPLDAGFSPIISVGQMLELRRGFPVCVPITDPRQRSRAVAEVQGHGFSQYPSLVDPSAVVSGQSQLARGVVVNSQVAVASGCRIDQFVNLNRSCSIGHDNVVGDFAHIGPGAVTTGYVEIGPYAFVGAGATILPRIEIGADAVVGAGSVVVEDVPAGATVVGNPAKLLVVRKTRPLVVRKSCTKEG